MTTALHIMPDPLLDRIVVAKMREDSSGRLIATGHSRSSISLLSTGERDPQEGSRLRVHVTQRPDDNRKSHNSREE